jgi:HipA-like protein
MEFKDKKIEALDVYLDQRKSRKYVGRLTKKKKWYFEYSESYLLSTHPIPIGPEIPVTNQIHESRMLFPSFEDRIPSRKNPAYVEYCKATGLSPEEKDPLILLSTIGAKGPSSFIFVPVRSMPQFGRFDLIRFRKSLSLSVREFALLFDVSTSIVNKIETGKADGKEILKRIEIYYRFPEVAMYEIQKNGILVHANQREYVENQVRKWIKHSK